MMSFDYDLIVLGAGSGGVRAARLAAQLGQKVCVIEEDRPGGTCVLRGCVPKKLMVYASKVPHDIHTAKGYGWKATSGKFDWSAFRNHLESELTRLSAIYEANLVKAGVEVLRGHGAFIDSHTIEITNKNEAKSQTIRGRIILIAVGGWPFIPDDIPGARQYGLSSNEMFGLDSIPKDMVIVGGGYIAVEFAGIMAGLGSKVTLVYRGDQILRGFDRDVRRYLFEELTQKGIEVRTQTQVTEIKRGKHRLQIQLSDGTLIKADQILYASGRKPKTDTLNLDKASVKSGPDGAVLVNDLSQTEAPHIYAIGDVTNRVNLTPVAIREAVAFVETVFKDTPTAYDRDTIPTAVFSQPEIGTVGLSEDEAIQKSIPYDVYETRFRAMKTAFVGNSERTYMKLIVERESDAVIGCHIIGDSAGEMIQLAGIAVKAKISKAQWDATCAVHPTAAEELVTLRDKRQAVG